MKAYLMGETYWIQPIQSGKLAEFLKSPENKKSGKSKMGVIAAIDF